MSSFTTSGELGLGILHQVKCEGIQGIVVVKVVKFFFKNLKAEIFGYGPILLWISKMIARMLLLPLLYTSATTTTTESALELLIGDTGSFLKHYFDVQPYHMIRDDDENKKTIASLCVF